MIVVDASVLAAAVLDLHPQARRVRDRLRGERMTAPSLVDVEVIWALRRLALAGEVDERTLLAAVRALMTVRVRRVHQVPYLPRMWALRHNLTAYDAAYVALAEATGAPLLTADRKLANAPGIACDVELIA